MPETSWQQFRETIVNALIDADFRRRIDAFKPPTIAITAPPRRQNVKKAKNPHETRGSKPGVKRGPYKKINPAWKTAPYTIEFKSTKPINIGSPPKTLKDEPKA